MSSLNSQISKNVRKFYMLFAGIMGTHFILYSFILMFAFGIKNYFRIMKYMLLPVIVMSVVIFVIYYFTTSVFRSDISSGSSEISERVNRTPLTGGVTFILGSFFYTLIIVFIGRKIEVIISGPQMVFFILLSLMLTFILAMYFYYKAKTAIYALRNRMAIAPLTLFHKILIPVMCTSMAIFLLLFTGYYKQSYTSVSITFAKLIEARIKTNAQLMNSVLGSLEQQLDTVTRVDSVADGNKGAVKALLSRMDSAKKSYIDSYFYSDLKGDTISSYDTQSLNISTRDYFINAVATKKPVISEPMPSMIDGGNIVVFAYPVLKGGAVTGLLCCIITIDVISEMFSKDATGSGKYFICSKEGKILLHPVKDLVGKVIGVDLRDDGKLVSGITGIITSPPNVFFEYTFNGAEVIGYKTEIPLMGHWLGFSLNKRDFIAYINPLMVLMIVIILFVTTVIYFLIYYIARSFSKPIRRTMKYIEQLAKGDLTVENRAVTADELGLLIESFTLFQMKLKEILNQLMGAAVQLSSSAEELASTSSAMSDSSQSQAASLEQASGSIEEMSGSIELINNSAKDQADLTAATFKSMDGLKQANQTVTSYAGEAMTAAKGLTEQANAGKELMGSTIEGMNKIDASTKKIAETVLIISDISDKVNLLALNASIEAARAGEHGKGFAVVAEEISVLADQTARGAKTINELVKEGLVEVDQGRKYVDSTSRALNNIISLISRTEELVKKIAESSSSQGHSSSLVLNDTRKVMDVAEAISRSTGEQMIANREMSIMIEQINRATQGSAAAAEEIASSAEQISAQSESMRSQIGYFKL